IRWADRKDRVRLAPRRLFPSVHKAVETGDIPVIRPAFLRAPILDIVSLVFTHFIEIHRQVREFRPDVIIGFGIMNSYLGIRVARRHGIPFVEYVIDELYRLMPRRVLQGPSKIVEQADYRRATLVPLINGALRDYTVAMGAPRQRTSVLRAGVDLERYTKSDGSEIRTHLGLEKSDLVLFYMGWLYPFSGLEQVAKDVTSRSVANRTAKLLAVGRGELWDSLSVIASGVTSAGRVILEPWLPYAELPGYIAAAAICLLPAEKVGVMENIVPIKMYEYMAAAKPVIATRLPGLVREFGENHGVVYVDDPREVVSTALRLADAGELPSL